MPNKIDKTVTLFEQVTRQFNCIEKQSIQQYYIKIANNTICLNFANNELIPLILPAIAHNLTQADVADLTINLWDTASTGIQMASMPWHHSDFASRREIRDASINGYSVTYDLYCGIFSILSIADRQAYWWINSAQQLPVYEQAAPIREILNAWFANKGGMFIHGAAVGNQSGCLVFVGKGGSGKSTTVLSCLSSDRFHLLGEDYCLLTDMNTTPQIHSLYNSAKLDNLSLDRLPHYKELIINANRSPDEKGILLLHPNYRLEASSPVKAIVIPQVSERESSHFETTTSAQILIALAPSTILQLSDMGQAALTQLKKFVSHSKGYKAYLSNDVADVIQMVTQLFNEVTNEN